MSKVEVRDSKNPERLLGFLTERPRPRWDGGDRLRMAIRPRIAVTYNRVDAQSRREDIQYIDFCREVLTSRDGWDATVVLTTDTPLGVLMWIDTFRLPSETEEQAYYRRQCAGL